MVTHDGSLSVNAVVAHILPASPGGPRAGTDAQEGVELNHESNLLLLCGTHHKLVDDHPDKFPAESLRVWKSAAEATETGILLSNRDAAAFASRLDSRTSALGWSRTGLQAQRERVGLTVEELARRSGVEPELIHRLESGIAYPTRTVLRALRAELALDADVPDEDLLKFVRASSTTTHQVEHLIRSLALHFVAVAEDSKFWRALNVANGYEPGSPYCRAKLRFASNRWLGAQRSTRPGELAYYVLALIDPAEPALAKALRDSVGPIGFDTTEAVGRRWLEEVFDLAWAVYSADMRKPGSEALAVEAVAMWGPNAEPLAELADHPDSGIRALVASNEHAPLSLLLTLAVDEDPEVCQAASARVADPAWCTSAALSDSVARRIGVAENPHCPPSVLEKLGQDREKAVRGAVAENPAASDSTLVRLLSDPDAIVRFDAQEAVGRRRAGRPSDPLDPTRET